MKNSKAKGTKNLTRAAVRRGPVLLAAVLSLVLMTGGPVIAAPVTPETEEEFTLAPGQVAIIQGENLLVRFDRVVEDSRCPALVICIWQGNARIRLTVFQPGERAATLFLNTNAAFPTEGEYHDYDIELVKLEPYPLTTRPIPQRRYRATLEVDD